MSKIRVFLIALLFLPVFGFLSYDFATVELFSPQGTVKDVRQVSARFSEEIVPFSTPTDIVPFDIDCPIRGVGRWMDGRHWMYDFDKDIEAGVVCTFKLKKDLLTLSGLAFEGDKVFTFSTGAPSIKHIYPYEGASIEEEQVFILSLDGIVDEQSVFDNLSFSVEGITEKIGANIIKGQQRQEILKAHFGDKFDNERTLLIQSKRSFPNDKNVTLVWGKGIKAQTGVTNELAQIKKYKTRSAFSATFSCERPNAEADCIPFSSMYLTFSSAISKETLKSITIQGDGKTYTPQTNEEDDSYGYFYSAAFNGPFPENTEFTIHVPKDIKDDAGRVLQNINKFPMKVKVGPYPPLAKFSSRFGIIERDDGVLPVTFRNVELDMLARVVQMPACANCPADKGVLDWIKKKLGTTNGNIHKIEDKREILNMLKDIAATSRRQSLLKSDEKTKPFTIKRSGEKKDFEVVGIPLGKPGFYVVELESLILGKTLMETQEPMYVLTSALVTNLSVHFKWGEASSLVWVTTLDSAEPVEGATVTIMDCNGNVHWISRTGENGIALIDNLPKSSELPYCDNIPADNDDIYLDYSQLTPINSLQGGLFVVVNTDEDMSFAHSSWNEGIEPWQFNLPQGDYSGDIIAHTIFDRELFRAGQKVHMKHIMRKKSMDGFSLLNSNKLPQRVVISHEASEQTYELPIEWDILTGSAQASWEIPKDAKLGSYSVTLKAAANDEDQYDDYEDSHAYKSGQFRVEEFKVPLLKSSLEPVELPLINKTDFNVDISVNYLSGGGAEGLGVKLRHLTSKKEIIFDDYSDYVFTNGVIAEGVEQSYDKYPDDDWYGDDYIEQNSDEASQKVSTQELTLQSAGALRARLFNIKTEAYAQNLLAELEFKDPNGEVQTVSKNITLWPSGVILGIKPDSWLLSKKAFKFFVVALDINGKPMSNIAVETELFVRKNYSHRRRLIGGFYAYEHKSEVKKVGALCKGNTDRRGILICETEAPISGNIIVQAKATDQNGNPSTVHREVWIAGEDDWWFDVKDSDRVDLIPEKKRYEPGEDATFQLRMPFRSATALISVEREGILDTQVIQLTGKNPTFKIPIKGNYAPNVYVSAFVVRGRVGDIKPSGLIDLGKPAYKIGISSINVGWREHELKVSVLPDKKTYKVRDKAEVKIKVELPDGKPFGDERAEVAVAAVDAGLLELAPNTSWDILSAMMVSRPYSVETSTAQMQVVGKRHYGLKAQPAGGGGGKAITRELFDTLLLWSGKVVLDKNGEAQVTVPLNDSLTAFKIAVVANAGAGLFGSGSSEIVSTQDIMLYSGLPQVVRQGDEFMASFTVKNSTNEDKSVSVAAVVTSDNATVSLTPITKTLSAGSASEVSWLFNVPTDATTLMWDVAALDSNGDTKDKLKVNEEVIPDIPVRVLQSTVVQLDGYFEMSVNPPLGAKNGVGGVRVSFNDRLGDTAGIVTYMKNYPYSCMEQKVSKAIALSDVNLWSAIINDMPSYVDNNGLLKYFPTQRHGSDVLTSYVLSISSAANFEIPKNIRDGLENALENFVNGKIYPETVWHVPDLTVRKLAAIEALSTASSVQVSDAMFESITIEPNLWPTSALLDWINILYRYPSLNNREDNLMHALTILRSRLNFQGTSMQFSTEDTDNLWWLMSSSDVNSVRSIITLLPIESWYLDMPRMLKGALHRQRKGAWSTTVANAWGVVAIQKFATQLEAQPVNGESVALLMMENEKFSEIKKSFTWDKTNKDNRQVFFNWPGELANLYVEHSGSGKPWITIQSLAAIPLKEPLSTGYKIIKKIVPVEQKTPGVWSVGDVARVSIEAEAQADMTWVVINDPIPSGASILGSGLGRDSSILTKGEKLSYEWPIYEERTFTAFKAYYEYVRKGKWTIDYTVRFNNEGKFELPPTRIEALYVPEMFGEIPNESIVIKK